MKRKIIAIGLASLFVILTFSSLSIAKEVRRFNEPEGDFLVVIHYKIKGELKEIYKILEHATVKVMYAETQEVIDRLDEGNEPGETSCDEMYYFSLEDLGIEDGQELKVEASWKGETKIWNLRFDADNFQYRYYGFERESRCVNKITDLFQIILKNKQFRLFSILSNVLKI